jgi:type II restriction/modification system DNA methylase subunit YeeA
MRKALINKSRFIVTPESSEHRVFVFAPGMVLIQGSLFCIASDDDVTFGVLISRFHEIWATAQGNRLGVGNQRRYNKDVAFETFPFPQGLTPRPSGTRTPGPPSRAIAAAARELTRLRERWLNPADLVRREPEVVPGYPDRLVSINKEASQELKKRTLTDLYNQRPAWLAQAHERLDSAVAAAYGWPSDINEEAALKKLLELNLSRSA